MKFTRGKWCITCQQHALVHLESGTHLRILIQNSEEIEDWDWCSGPYAECAPPELQEDWYYNYDLYDVSDDELILMDLAADSLMLETEL
jgi:hypothetical protein